MIEGDHKPLTWTLYDSDGTVYDWTGVTKMWITVKASEHDDDDDAIIGPLNSVVHAAQVKYDYPTADAGQCWVKFSDTDTSGLAAQGTLVYDIQVIKNGETNTLVDGKIAWNHEKTVVNT
jgi:hypothetical protein